MAIPEPNDSYVSAFNIGQLATPRSYQDAIGGADLADFYKFTIAQNSTLTLNLLGLTADAEIAIVSDINQDGQYSTSEIIDTTSLSGSVDRTLISDLGTGTYYALVSPGNSFSPRGDENTGYTLQLIPQAIAGVNPTTDPGISYPTAFNVGTLTAAKTYKQFVGGADLGDLYRFTITQNSTVTLSLTGLREDAEIAIVSDINKDGQYSTSEIIDTTSLSGSVDRTLISDLGTGTYYALVSPGNSFSPRGDENTNYTLKLSPKAVVGVVPTTDPGFSYRSAFKIGQLTTTKTYKQFVGGADLGDFYQFSLVRNKRVTLTLTGLRADAEVAIVSDINKDGRYSTSEIIDSTSLSGSVDRTLISSLGKGTYYVLVSPGNSFSPRGDENTNYTLKISSRATRSGEQTTVPKQKATPKQQAKPRQKSPERPASQKRAEYIPQTPQVVTQPIEQVTRPQLTRPQPIAAGYTLQALSPACDALTIGAAVLALAKHCLLR
jgi:uncharacterized protein YdaT